MRVLGIDLGTKYVGLATADTSMRIATGLQVIEYKNREKLLGNLKSILHDHNIELIVIGLPVNMNGSEGKKAKEARDMAALLSADSGLEVEFVDETLTTAQAITQLHAGRGKVGKSRRQINMMAATLILQEFLDGLQQKS